MAEFASLEFFDFDSFREQLRGWDTDPVQMGAGPLRLHWDEFRLEDFGLGRLHVNRRLTDCSALEPGGLGFVVTLRPQLFCGVEAPAGSLIVLGPGREHRSTLTEGFQSVEIMASEELLHEAGLLENGIDPRALPPESCVLRLGRGLVAGFEGLAAEVRVRGRSPISEAWAASIERRALRLLARGLRGSDVRGIRRVPRYDLALAALRLVELNAEERLTVGELANALRVTSRALEYAFRGALGASPARYLLSQRLNRVRRDLVAGVDTHVTAAASRRGFDHLGRFAGHYRRLFGELPSETLRTAVRGSMP